MFCAGADLKERKELDNDATELFVADLRSTFDDFYVLTKIK